MVVVDTVASSMSSRFFLHVGDIGGEDGGRAEFRDRAVLEGAGGSMSSTSVSKNPFSVMMCRKRRSQLLSMDDERWHPRAALRYTAVKSSFVFSL